MLAIYTCPTYTAPFDTQVGQASGHLEVDAGVADGFQGSLRLDVAGGSSAEKPNESAEALKARSERHIHVNSLRRLQGLGHALRSR